jgi:hypothetical protein
MKLAGWLLLLSLPAAAQGFDRTRWGMTEAEVEACYPGRTWSPTCSDGTRSVSQVKLEHSLDGVKVKVDFYFRDGRLDNVEIAPAAGSRPVPGALEASRSLLEGLVRRHGQPREHEGPADGTEGFRWHLPGTKVWASRTLTATDCVFTIQYLPHP